MNRNQRNWKVLVSGLLLLRAGAAAEQASQIYLNSTNRVTVSLQYGMNISGSFKSQASFHFPTTVHIPNSRRTPNGDLYNYDNGYVLTDISGDAGNQTWYWGYDSSSQVNAANHTIAFNRSSVSEQMTGDSSTERDDSSHLGVELMYNYEIGQKEDWHDLRYGLEAAINYMPFQFSSQASAWGSQKSSQITDVYSYTPGTTPPGYNVPSELPYQGTYQGPNFVINTPPVSRINSVTSGGAVLVNQKFEADLWGFRLGPYLEMPLTKRLSLHLSGGLALGLIADDASWQETSTMLGSGPRPPTAGNGSDTGLLWGGYVGLQAQYQFSPRWGVEAGVQFQDLGIYDHNFGSRDAHLDLSESVLVQAGISFSF